MNFLWKHLHEHVTRINGVSIRKWVLDYNIFQMFSISVDSNQFTLILNVVTTGMVLEYLPSRYLPAQS